MKKSIKITLIICVVCVVFASCSKDVQYIEANGSWVYYENAAEVVDTAGMVFLGKITDISFQVLDITTGNPPTDETQDKFKWLVTIYSVEVIETYKGQEENIDFFVVSRGIKDCYIEEQLEVIKNGNLDIPDNTIPIWYDHVSIHENLNQPCVFAVAHRNDMPWSLINLDQSVYNLEQYFTKTSANTEDQTEYDPYTNKISLKDVVSQFGEDKWNDLQTKWQNGEIK